MLDFTIDDVCNDKENQGMVIKIQGDNPDSDTDPLSEEYYYGKVEDVPISLRKYQVRNISWALGAQCHVISINYIMGKYSHFNEWKKYVGTINTKDALDRAKSEAECFVENLKNIAENESFNYVWFVNEVIKNINNLKNK